MCRISKIISYVSVSLFLSYLESLGSGVFFNQIKENIIPLLATLLAINITTSALIAVELKKFISQFNEADPNKVTKELKFSFVIQLFALLFLFLVLLINDLSIQNLIYKKYSELITNAIVIGVFLYYMEIILDLGKALLQILNANTNSKNK